MPLTRFGPLMSSRGMTRTFSVGGPASRSRSDTRFPRLAPRTIDFIEHPFRAPAIVVSEELFDICCPGLRIDFEVVQRAPGQRGDRLGNLEQHGHARKIPATLAAVHEHPLNGPRPPHVPVAGTQAHVRNAEI